MRGESRGLSEIYINIIKISFVVIYSNIGTCKRFAR
jgi:hypothetical protein